MRFSRYGLLGLLLFYSAAVADETPGFTLTIKNHRFEPATLQVPADTRLKLTVKNQDATAEEFEGHALHVEKIIPAGGEGIIYVRPLEPGSYPFVGEFHQGTAKGELIAK